MKQFRIGDIVSRAWDLAVKHWPIFVFLTFVNNLISGIGLNVDAEAYMAAIENSDVELLEDAFSISPWLAVSVLLAIYLGYVLLNLYVTAFKTGKPYKTLSQAFGADINQLATYFFTDLVYGLIVGVGTLFFIVPGIFFAVRLAYAPLLAATQGASFAGAFRQSWNLTKGHFWDVFLLFLTMLGIAVLGFCACCVGYFFAAVVMNFMLVVSFYVLAPQPEAAEPAE